MTACSHIPLQTKKQKKTKNNDCCPSTVTDFDGNTYNTVLIGDQCWMKENLKVTHYPNGDNIPYITDNGEWVDLADNNTDDAYCFYENDRNSEHGALYCYAAAIGDNWKKGNVKGQGICPDGWQIPTDSDWKILEGTVDTRYPVEDPEWDKFGYRGYDAGTHMKSTMKWDFNGSGDNSSGFSALSGGSRWELDGKWYNDGWLGFWWSATEESNDRGVSRRLDSRSDTKRLKMIKSEGLSVRCVKRTVRKSVFR